MNYYKKELEKAEASGTKEYHIEVAVAKEVKAQADWLKLSDADFEVLCEEVHNWYLDTENSLQEIVACFIKALVDKTLTIKDLKTDINPRTFKETKVKQMMKNKFQMASMQEPKGITVIAKIHEDN